MSFPLSSILLSILSPHPPPPLSFSPSLLSFSLPFSLSTFLFIYWTGNSHVQQIKVKLWEFDTALQDL